ncbi:AP-3 complex subunit beta-1 [Nymphon striatum]|nr:AP-3 complex subunit beta-1 [Nymphon striatum]
MASNGSLTADKGPSNGDPEFGHDPASGGFFSSDYKKHEDLKNMLDSNKDGLKLEAMKRIIGMVAKGRDASDLFPAVVKNVVSKNIEVKKLVYVYLVRYAEEQQDLALLSISTFQRGLKDPNQLIRASALRVLSSIRVPVIVPIMMLGIKDSVSDMSPYVRKTAAHAIPKLYSLDPDQKDELIEVIEKLLSDKTTLVVGSAVMAFEEVCPERIDLVHKNYRKLCNLLVDVEEWGQVVIINMLTRYSRTQFIDPNKEEFMEEENQPFYENEESSEEDESADKEKKKPYIMDPDHRLLLRNCKPLLQSRNAAVSLISSRGVGRVVMAVVQLYYYIAPRFEVNIVTKALIRLLHSHRMVRTLSKNELAKAIDVGVKNRWACLEHAVSISLDGKGMFEPFLKSFFVRSSDSTHIKLLKLDILTNLATESNISVILREFQTYVSNADKDFVAATIQAIGRCASSISEVTDTCLNGLVSLLSNRDEAVVAESVVVIKKLLQMQPTEHKLIIGHMARLVDSIAVPMARASILWLLGEYSDRVPRIAPDVLRKMAKTFINEEDIVKLQILNLATKLLITNPKQTKLLSHYVFNLAKYDQNYDLRDRARLLRQLVQPSGDKSTILAKHAKKIFLSPKPAPVLQSRFKDRDAYQLGSLSHYIFARAYGYNELPEFPENEPDPSVRNVEVANDWGTSSHGSAKKKRLVNKPFYEPESSSEDEDSSEIDSDDSEEISDSESGEGSSVEDEEEVEDDEDESEEESSNEESDETDSSESSSESEDEVQTSKKVIKTANSKVVAKKKELARPTKPVSNLDLLLDFDDTTTITSAPPIQPATGSSLLMPMTSSTEKSLDAGPTFSPLSTPVYVSHEKMEILNKVSGNGLSVEYRFSRSINIFCLKMTSIELTLTNHGPEPMKSIKIDDKKTASGVEIHGIPLIESLASNSSMSVTIGINFNESMQPGIFDIKSESGKNTLTIKAPIGEIIQSVSINETSFITYQNKLRGMNENSATVDVLSGNTDPNAICSRIYQVANVLKVTSDSETLTSRFAGQTLSTNSLVLITIKVLDNNKINVTVNCDKMVIGSMLLKEMKQALIKI